MKLQNLRELTVLARSKTLSEAARELHVSQSTLSRSMKSIESNFGVPLFKRSKNAISLNECGKLAVIYAEKILQTFNEATENIQELYKKLRVLRICSCAPVPLSYVTEILNKALPEKRILGSLQESTDQIIDLVKNDKCDLGIIPEVSPDDSFISFSFCTENLSVLVSNDHPLYQKDQVTFADLNGFNCILRDNIGFWTPLVKKKMPASLFFIQKEDVAFDELTRASNLIRFCSDLFKENLSYLKSRRKIPLISPEARVTYNLICKDKKRQILQLIKKYCYELTR